MKLLVLTAFYSVSFRRTRSNQLQKLHIPDTMANTCNISLTQITWVAVPWRLFVDI